MTVTTIEDKAFKKAKSMAGRVKSLGVLVLAIIIFLLFWQVKPAEAFFWQNEPEMTKQEAYENDAQARELSRQMFIQATLNALKSQKEYAKEKAGTALVNEDTVELNRLTKVITSLNKDIVDVKEHTRIVFMKVGR